MLKRPAALVLLVLVLALFVLAPGLYALAASEEKVDPPPRGGCAWLVREGAEVLAPKEAGGKGAADTGANLSRELLPAPWGSIGYAVLTGLGWLSAAVLKREVSQERAVGEAALSAVQSIKHDGLRRAVKATARERAQHAGVGARLERRGSEVKKRSGPPGIDVYREPAAPGEATVRKVEENVNVLERRILALSDRVDAAKAANSPG